jgi:predicted O-methyltransferase YrrM
MFGIEFFPESNFTVNPTSFCPRPDLYSSPDTDAAEREILEFLAALVRATKPEFVLETGTHLGRSACYIADALRRNGVGRMVTLETNGSYITQAQELLAGQGLLGTGIGNCESLLISSFDYKPTRPINFLFSDSELGHRIEEMEYYRPYLAPYSWIAMHDTMSHKGTIGDLSVLNWIERIDIPSPRGLTVGRLA